MKFNHIITSILAVSLIIIPSKILQAKTLSEAGFKEYVIELKEAALAQGFSQSLIDESFTNVKFHKRAVAADRKQPEKVETLDTYLPKRIPAWKVDKA